MHEMPKTKMSELGSVAPGPFNCIHWNLKGKTIISMSTLFCSKKKSVYILHINKINKESFSYFFSNLLGLFSLVILKSRTLWDSSLSFMSTIRSLVKINCIPKTWLLKLCKLLKKKKMVCFFAICNQLMIFTWIF